MILICLPYAGGSEGIYINWTNYLDNSIKIFPISLKGRGRRFYEDFYKNLDEAIDDIFSNIKNEIKDDEYSIYGHSMGALLAYELYYKIKENNLTEPKHIFFSGYGSPNINKSKDDIYKLSDEDFIKAIIELGGTPKEVFENKELLEIFIPVLRSDFKLLSKYSYTRREDKINCDISIFNGKEDSITEEEILGWIDLSNNQVDIYNFDGDHFFINDNIENIADVINDKLIG